ncbi:hypothetical protein LTR70_001390 [Exophiala xenobiotica]|uniref:Uncharacterized protein n=1 Tax=Lithohypha guttulata TaxID=1690604 RepID=A0ABR0KMA0_9EURO|nr:hypothetical protein LTR24_000855 [Lithohypha guttulata]KAK5328069.1 hypothetical protein LTR70_001390 [Exophiala xenobiotica]
MKLTLLAAALNAATALAAPTNNPAKLPPQGESIADSDSYIFSEPQWMGPPDKGHGRPYRPSLKHPQSKSAFQKRDAMSWDEVTSEAIAAHLILPDLISDPATGISFRPKTAKDLVGQCQAIYGDLEPDALPDYVHHQAKCVALVWNCQASNAYLLPYEQDSPTAQTAAGAEAQMVGCVMGGVGVSFIGGKKGQPNWEYIVNELEAERRIAEIKGETTWTGEDIVDEIEESGTYGEVLDKLREGEPLIDSEGDV